MNTSQQRTYFELSMDSFHRFTWIRSQNWITSRFGSVDFKESSITYTILKFGPKQHNNFDDPILRGLWAFVAIEARKERKHRTWLLWNKVKMINPASALVTLDSELCCGMRANGVSPQSRVKKRNITSVLVRKDPRKQDRYRSLRWPGQDEGQKDSQRLEPRLGCSCLVRWVSDQARSHHRHSI